MSATAYWRWRFGRTGEPWRYDSREFKGGYVGCSRNLRVRTRRSRGVRGRIGCTYVWKWIGLLSGSGYAEFHLQVAQGEDPLKSAMTATLLQLGDSTSRNLEFSHCRNVWVSYGEETITESNLLEIRRRHPELVRIRTFTKRKEAKTGADWEWHIVGRRRTVKMRVQAKRLQCNGVLRVKHKVKSSGRQQRSLLIAGARAAKMKPVYCIYSTEQQRTIWTQPKGQPGYRTFQTGCLLADAADVPLWTRKLDEVEQKCIPWHFLFEPTVSMQWTSEIARLDYEGLVQFVSFERRRLPVTFDGEAAVPPESFGWNAPTIDDLNENTRRDFDWTGVEETTAEDRARLEPETDEGRRIVQSDRERLRELGILRMMVMDVRGEPKSDERYEW